MNKNIILMCGLPGSGKSYQSIKYFKEHPNSVIINLDKIREMLVGEYQLFPFDNSNYSKDLNQILFDIKHEAIANALSSNIIENIIIDETHINKKSRNKSKQLIENEWFDSYTFDYKITIIYCSESENNLKYRMESPKGNSEQCWDSVINNMKKYFEIPNKDECDFLIEIKR